MVFSLLLRSHNPTTVTYGRESGISIAILATNRAIYNEAIDLLYDIPHELLLEDVVSSPSITRPLTSPPRPLPPYRAITRMRSITLAITFSTINRGDCEISIEAPQYITGLTDPLALHLLRSPTLISLTLLLLNANQRKVGANHFRLRAVTDQMKRILLPFAYLPLRIHTEIAGFNTLDYAEMFDDMRPRCAGKNGVIDRLLDNAWEDAGFWIV